MDTAQHPPGIANLYEALEVSTRASPEVIHAAYRALARTFHPDVNAEQAADQRMRQLNAAYHVLSDPDRRARYDASGARRARARGRAEAARQRAASRTPTPKPMPGWREVGADGGFLRVALALALVGILVGMLCLAVWLAFDAMDDRPPALIGSPVSSADQFLGGHEVGRPLNRASTGGRQPTGN